MGDSVWPSHLLALDHTFGDQRVHGRLGERGRDRIAALSLFPVVRQVRAVHAEVEHEVFEMTLELLARGARLVLDEQLGVVGVEACRTGTRDGDDLVEDLEHFGCHASRTISRGPTHRARWPRPPGRRCWRTWRAWMERRRPCRRRPRRGARPTMPDLSTRPWAPGARDGGSRPVAPSSPEDHPAVSAPTDGMSSQGTILSPDLRVGLRSSPTTRRR